MPQRRRDVEALGRAARRKARIRIVADTPLAPRLLVRRTQRRRRVRRRARAHLAAQHLLDQPPRLASDVKVRRELVQRAPARTARLDARQQLALERHLDRRRPRARRRVRRRRRLAAQPARIREPRRRRAHIQPRRPRKLHAHTLHVACRDVPLHKRKKGAPQRRRRPHAQARGQLLPRHHVRGRRRQQAREPRTQQVLPAVQPHVALLRAQQRVRQHRVARVRRRQRKRGPRRRRRLALWLRVVALALVPRIHPRRLTDLATRVLRAPLRVLGKIAPRNHIVRHMPHLGRRKFGD